MRWHVVLDNAWFLATGLGRTLWMSAVVIVASFVLGNIVAAMRVSRIRSLSVVAAGYVELMRATPLLMIIFWFYFTLPLLTGHAPSPLLAAVSGMIAFRCAAMAEVVRGGLRAVSKGQWEAAQASGLGSLQVLVHVVLPQAVVNMLPSLTSQSVATIKSTSLAYIIGVIELTRAGNVVMNREYTTVEVLSVVALTYLCVNLLVSQSGQALWQAARRRSGLTLV
jgi:polar amino acid transport system permease protein